LACFSGNGPQVKKVKKVKEKKALFGSFLKKWSSGEGCLVGISERGWPHALFLFPLAQKAHRLPACNGKEHTAIKPTGTPKPLKPLANRVAVSSQQNLHTRLTCYFSETALLLHEICIDKHWIEIYP
jgi:hypothetical protein